MNLNLDIDMNSLLAEAVARALQPDALQALVQKNVDAAVKSVIDESIGYSGPFRKALEEAVSASMPTTFEGLGRFSDLVLKTVQSTVSGVQSQVVRDAIEEKLTRMLKPLPPVMDLSDLVRRLVEQFEKGHSFERDGSSRPSMRVEKSSDVDGYWYLRADPSVRRDGHSCRYVLKFLQDEKTGLSECWSVKIDEEDPYKSLLLGPAFNAEALILALYTGGVKVRLDREDFSDVVYSDSEGDDY